MLTSLFKPLVLATVLAAYLNYTKVVAERQQVITQGSTWCLLVVSLPLNCRSSQHIWSLVPKPEHTKVMSLWMVRGCVMGR